MGRLGAEQLKTSRAGGQRAVAVCVGGGTENGSGAGASLPPREGAVARACPE